MSTYTSINVFRDIPRAFPDSSVCLRMENNISPAAKAQYGPLPPAGVPVQIQCIGYKCMAYRDSEGRWVDLFSREFVPRVLGVVPA
jgi:hypothetical protein